MRRGAHAHDPISRIKSAKQIYTWINRAKIIVRWNVLNFSRYWSINMILMIMVESKKLNRYDVYAFSECWVLEWYLCEQICDTRNTCGIRETLYWDYINVSDAYGNTWYIHTTLSVIKDHIAEIIYDMIDCGIGDKDSRPRAKPVYVNPKET